MSCEELVSPQKAFMSLFTFLISSNFPSLNIRGILSSLVADPFSGGTKIQKGNIDMKSMKNQPLMYSMAISLNDQIHSVVSGSRNPMNQLNMKSKQKNTSTIQNIISSLASFSTEKAVIQRFVIHEQPTSIRIHTSKNDFHFVSGCIMYWCRIL